MDTRKSDIIRPGYHQGFGTYQSSAAPNLWRDVVGAYAPFLGVTGGRLLDHSHLKKDGVLDGAIWVPTPEGWALKFNGDGDNVEVAAHPSINNIWDGGGTIRFKLKSTIALNGFVLDKRTSGGPGGWFIQVRDYSGNNAKIRFFADFEGLDDGTWDTTNRVISVNQFPFPEITIIWTASVAFDPIILVNGISVAVTEIQAPEGTRIDDSGADLFIGNRGLKTAGFEGLISDVILYNKAKTLVESFSHSIKPYAMYERSSPARSFFIPPVPTSSPSASPSVSPSISPSASPSPSVSPSVSPSLSPSISPSASPPPSFVGNLSRDLVKNITNYAQLKNITDYGQIKNITDYGQIKCIG